MTKLLFLFFLPLTLFAQHPKVYSSLGNEIYDTLDAVKDLKHMEYFKKFEDKINNYSSKVMFTKELGFDVESGRKPDAKGEYLTDLRKLKKIKDYFSHLIKKSLNEAITKQDNVAFVQAANSKLLNLDENKVRIMEYYDEHASYIQAAGRLQKLIDKEISKKSRKKYVSSKLIVQDAKIARLRENDLLKTAKLEKKLNVELEAKKAKIAQEQEAELFK